MAPHIKPWILWFVLVGVAFDLFVSAALFRQNQETRNAASSAHIARVSSYTSCLAGNTFRTSDLKRWDQVLTLINTMPSNPAEQKFIRGVDAANRTADEQQPCKKP